MARGWIDPASRSSAEDGELPFVGREDSIAHQLVKQYLKEIEEIDQRATQAKAEAGTRLLNKLGEQDRPRSNDKFPGLIGTAVVDDKPTSIAYHYHPGKVFPPELIRDRFHHVGKPQPSVTITLVGSVELPQDMTVKVWHAAGGVNQDWGELYVGDRLLGRVGDDLAKKVIYVVKLPKGKHAIRWVLRGGTFQHNFLKFEDPQTGALLRVCFDVTQYVDSCAATSTELVEAAMNPGDWPPAVNNQEWHWESVPCDRGESRPPVGAPGGPTGRLEDVEILPRPDELAEEIADDL